MKENQSFDFENKFEVKTPQKSAKRFIIGYIFFVIILGAITASCIYFTIKNENNNDNERYNTTNEQIEIKEAEDKKYTITSYSDTYNNNAIKITQYYDIDGEISTTESFEADYEYRVSYIQIDGLKDKTLQSKINDRIRKTAYKLIEGKTTKTVETFVYANFSNILSINIYGHENNNIIEETININLANGEDIRLEDLFISSATINSYLADALYETLLWNDYFEGGGDIGEFDIQKLDSSEYEEKFLMLINNYKKNKNDLKFTISANSITIYNLLDNRIIDDESVRKTITINLIKYIEEVTMYKRFLTDESIYENDTVGTKGTIVFTEDLREFRERINYGKITDNVFLEEVVVCYEDDYYENENIKVGREYIEKLSSELISNLRKYNDSGMFYQVRYYIEYEENKYISINARTYQAKCSRAYFKNDAFFDYIKLKSEINDGLEILGFSEYKKENFPNLTIMKEKEQDYFISPTGELLGTNREEVEKKLNNDILPEESVDLEEDVEVDTDVNEILPTNIINNSL